MTSEANDDKAITAEMIAAGERVYDSLLEVVFDAEGGHVALAVAASQMVNEVYIAMELARVKSA